MIFENLGSLGMITDLWKLQRNVWEAPCACSVRSYKVQLGINCVCLSCVTQYKNYRYLSRLIHGERAVILIYY